MGRAELLGMLQAVVKANIVKKLCIKQIGFVDR